jgi:transcriptional antiterminator RfaH
MPIVTVPNPDPFVAADPWFVLRTRSRQEKAVAEVLGAMGIAFFLPLLPVVRFYGPRKFTVKLPMFPCYLFCRGSLEQSYAIDRTKRTAGILRVTDQGKLDWELRNIALALENKVPLDPYPCLRQGLRAEVQAGPLRGLQGLIESRTKLDRLVLQVEMLGRAVSVEVDASLLQVVEEVEGDADAPRAIGRGRKDRHPARGA